MSGTIVIISCRCGLINNHYTSSIGLYFLLLCFQLEGEIATLRSVLDAKILEASELKQKLGITPLVEFKDDFKHGIQVIKESETLVFVASFHCVHNETFMLFGV